MKLFLTTTLLIAAVEVLRRIRFFQVKFKDMGTAPAIIPPFVAGLLYAFLVHGLNFWPVLFCTLSFYSLLWIVVTPLFKFVTLIGDSFLKVNFLDEALRNNLPGIRYTAVKFGYVILINAAYLLFFAR